MYTTEIITLLSWPVLIALSYYLSVLALKKFDNQIKK